MISSFPILNETIFIDEQNGNFSINRDELLTIGSYPIDKAPSYSHNLYSTIVFCLEISNACNLRCSYCFNRNKDGTKMSFESIGLFICDFFNGTEIFYRCFWSW